MPELWMDVDAALAEVPVNVLSLIDDTDFKSREEAIAFNAAGMELIWHFTTTAGATSATVVTPTVGGDYDWAHQDGGLYTIEMTATGGASANNDTEGFGWFTGIADGVLPWRGPVIGFRLAATNNILIDGTIGMELAIADAVWDEVLTGATHNIATSAGRRLRQLEQAFTLASGTVAAVSGHTVTLDGGAVATAGYYIGARLQITEGNGAGQSRIIVAYSGGKVATLDSEFVTAPNAASLYEVISADVHVSVSDSDLATGFVAVATNTTTITLDAAAVATTDYYVGELIVFTHGTGKGQAREITAYTSGRVVTMSPALVTAVSTDTTYHIQASVSVPEIVDEVWNEALSGHTTAGTGGKLIGDMTFTKANELDVNTKSINDAEVIGDGNATPWDGV